VELCKIGKLLKDKLSVSLKTCIGELGLVKVWKFVVNTGKI
jgi:hypothetical protein